MELIAAAVIVVAIVGTTFAGLRHHQGVLRLRKRVIVSTHAGYGVEGVLYSRSGRTIVLRDSRVTTNGEDRPPVPVDGELLLDRDQIVWIQVVN